MHDGAPVRHLQRLGTDTPATVDVERRTLRAVAATQDLVPDYGNIPGGGFGHWFRELDMSGADLSRFIGGPVLRDHAATTRDTVGVIDAARIEGGKLIADIRLSSRDDVTSLLADIADGHYLALQPRYLLVGPASELAARQLVAELSTIARDDVQPWPLEVLVEPRVQDGAWHLFAAPGPHSPLEFGYLSGSAGVQVTAEDGFETLGTKYRAVLDFGCGVVDCRGAYNNAGA